MMQPNATLELITALLVGLLLASFVEYLVHRFMHMGKFMGPRHAKHHRSFGTYRATDRQPERPVRDYRLRQFIDIRWL
ncbi:MAG: hypothetical protein ACC742_05825 [Thermoanaerobaculales bacterium]